MIRLFSVLVLSTLTACGGSGNGVCREGDVCDCEGQGVCNWECRGGGCDFTVTGQGLASLSCEDGGCSVDATGQGAVNLSCAGGACDVSCMGQGTCTVTECTGCTCDAGAQAFCVFE